VTLADFREAPAKARTMACRSLTRKAMARPTDLPTQRHVRDATPRVVERFVAWFTERYGNAASAAPCEAGSGRAVEEPAPRWRR